MNYPTNLSKMCSKKDLMRGLDCVRFTKNSIVATDSFKLIEIKGENGFEGLVEARLLKKGDVVIQDKSGTVTVKRGKAIVTLPSKEPDSYPMYEAVLKEQLDAPGTTIKVNRQYLADLLAAMPSGELDAVFLKVPTDSSKAIVVTNELATGLVMPIMR